jgi:hypothetical protein
MNQKIVVTIAVLFSVALLYSSIGSLPIEVGTAQAATNLAPLKVWDLTYGTGPQIIKLDYAVTYNGQPTIRLDRHTSADMNNARECNTNGIRIQPGDRIVFKCWMKTTKSGFGDTNLYSGARIGIDFYGSGRCLGAVQSPTYPDTHLGVRQNYVNWGTSQWTERTIQFTVPKTIGGITPTAMILWMQVWSSTYGSTDPGQAWFANPQLYKNP